MNQEQKIERMAQVFDQCLQLAKDKGHDYSGNESAMSNLKDFGWQGVVVRLSDKYHRLKNFCKQATLKVKDESVRDTFSDMINYACLALLMFDEENDTGTATYSAPKNPAPIAKKKSPRDDDRLVVYVAGPYTANTKKLVDENIARADEVGRRLLAQGFVPLIPHRISAHWDVDDRFMHCDHDYWLKEFCYPLLEKCDAIFMCEGWQQSKGAVMEYRFAIENGIPVFHDIYQALSFRESRCVNVGN